MGQVLSTTTPSQDKDENDDGKKLVFTALPTDAVRPKNVNVIVAVSFNGGGKWSKKRCVSLSFFTVLIVVLLRTLACVSPNTEQLRGSLIITIGICMSITAGIVPSEKRIWSYAQREGFKCNLRKKAFCLFGQRPKYKREEKLRVLVKGQKGPKTTNFGQRTKRNKNCEVWSKDKKDQKLRVLVKGQKGTFTASFVHEFWIVYIVRVLGGQRELLQEFWIELQHGFEPVRGQYRKIGNWKKKKKEIQFFSRRKQ